MERVGELQAAAAHKRKGSAVEMLDGVDPKAARPSVDGEQHEGSQKQPPHQPLTHTCNLHVTQLRVQQEALNASIDEITAVGLAFLDRMRASFQSRMAKVKEELATMVACAEDNLCHQSSATIDCRQRAEIAAQLVGKLNIKALDAEQQRPETLFTEQEAEVDAEQAVQLAAAAAAGEAL